MNSHVLAEPSLEFAGGARHLDPRFGITEYGPADLMTPGAPRTINVGILGAQADIDATCSWLESCQAQIDGKSQKRAGLWPAWPGFTAEVGYRAELTLEKRLQRPIKALALAKLDGLDPRKRVDTALGLFLDELRTLVQEGRPDVVICCIPDSLIDLDAPPRVPSIDPPDVVDTETAETGRAHSFHDLLKARAMPLRVPLQLLRASTYDPSRAGQQRRRTWKTKQRQDPASIAWNFFTALGVVVRGGPAYRSNEDRQLHLSESDAHAVARDAMNAYRGEHRHFPARIIVQKTSPFDDHEREGMLRAADELGLDSCELVWITNP